MANLTRVKTFGYLIGILLLCSSCGSFSKLSKIGLPESDDYKLFASRRIEPGTEPFHFYTANRDLNLGEKIEVDSRKIDAGDESLELFLKDHKTLSFLIIRNDTIVYQYYDESKADSSIVTSFSVAKAFISGLVGIAISEGKIPGTNASIVSYFPELTNQGFEPVTIDHLLDHTSGIHYKEKQNHVGGNLEFYWGKDLKTDIFNIHPVFTPGEHFEYSNINTQLLAMILERATGMNVSEYLQEKIWKPIGMEYPATWSLSNERPDGIEKAFCCLNARTTDFAKFGRLYLNRGNWNGKQIIPDSWINQSLHSSKENGQRLTYHYNWGIGPKKYGSFYAIGLYGQLIYIYPEKNVIIVRFGKADLNYNPPFLYHTFLQICDQL
jgi:CubicO group peptidase (beta-lactamase class C family)